MGYSIYGLWLSSDLPIPGLVAEPAAPPPDVQVWLDSRPSWLGELPKAGEKIWYTSPHQDAHGQPVLLVWKLAGGFFLRLRYSDHTEFLLDRAGSRIWATWPDTLTLEDTAVYLLGPVLGFVLRLRGVICLHASAVAVHGQALVLVGPAGAGKSSTAAAFARLGYSVSSDDVVPIREKGDVFLAESAYPRLCLWPDSVTSLYGSPDALSPLTPTWEKRYLALGGNGCQFQREPLPLGAIYLLGQRSPAGAAPWVEALPAREALMALVRNTYSTYLLDEAMRAREFELLGRVVARLPVRQVNPRADLNTLSGLSEAILEDFEALHSSPLEMREAT